MSLSVFSWDKFTWLNSSSYYGSDYSFMYNFVVGTYDVLGLLPPGGYPEWGGKPPWPPYKYIPSKGNCWRYACNDPAKPGEGPKAQPEFPKFDKKKREFRYTCDGVMKGARDKGAVDPDKTTGDCPCDYYKIKAVVMDKTCITLKDPQGKDYLYCDYHWYRQNDDGSWSHKPGDSSPFPNVPDPTKDAKDRGYDKDCGNLCVKGNGLDVD
jgi:hypothetical protein